MARRLPPSTQGMLLRARASRASTLLPGPVASWVWALTHIGHVAGSGPGCDKVDLTLQRAVTFLLVEGLTFNMCF